MEGRREKDGELVRLYLSFGSKAAFQVNFKPFYVFKSIWKLDIFLQ